MNPLCLESGSEGSGFFTPGHGASTVYLAPDLVGDQVDGRVYPSLAYSNDHQLQDHFGVSKMREAKERALETVGSRFCARYYENILAELFSTEEIDLKHIMTGVTTFTGNWYHDLGYIATRR